MSDVYVVGGGPSLAGFDFGKLRDRECIAVNKSIFDVPNAKYFITIDYTFLYKISNQIDNFVSHKATKVFVVNYASGNIKDINGQIRDVKFNILYDLSKFDIIIKSTKIGGFSTHLGDFRNGENSGYCALQLAIALGYDNIHLLGFDLGTTADTHYHGGYGMDKAKMDSNLNKFSYHFVNGIRELHDIDAHPHIISYDSPILSQFTESRALSEV